MTGTARSQSAALVTKRKGIKHLYHVDDEPLLLRPAFLAYGYGLGLVFYLYSGLVHASSSIEHVGWEQLSPDGPEGPPRQPKNGIIYLSARSGVPIVPVRIRCSRSLKLRGWDEKIIPLPFGKISVRYGAAIRVSAQDAGEALQALQAAL